MLFDQIVGYCFVGTVTVLFLSAAWTLACTGVAGQDVIRRFRAKVRRAQIAAIVMAKLPTSSKLVLLKVDDVELTEEDYDPNAVMRAVLWTLKKLKVSV